jgi:ABC-type branched-subunit amino acid transport system ATPase component
MRALERVGLADRADTLVGELSTGMRRLCDLATVIVAEPGLVLLDEPTSGIAQREVEAFAPLLRSLRDDLGCAILIVEHDVPLVMSLSDRVYCLESGRIISEGTPDEVRADPAVIASYLGTEAATIERSGGRRRTRAGAKRGAQ